MKNCPIISVRNFSNIRILITLERKQKDKYYKPFKFKDTKKKFKIQKLVFHKILTFQ